MAAHKHAEVIKAWADDSAAVIEWRRLPVSEWRECNNVPSFDVENEYRVRPEKPYPVTQMTQKECNDAWSSADLGLLAVANAALRHAVDNDYLLTPGDVKNRTHEHYQRGLGERDARDMAIARAADSLYCGLSTIKQPNSDSYLKTMIIDRVPK